MCSASARNQPRRSLSRRNTRLQKKEKKRKTRRRRRKSRRRTSRRRRKRKRHSWRIARHRRTTAPLKAMAEVSNLTFKIKHSHYLLFPIINKHRILSIQTKSE